MKTNPLVDLPCHVPELVVRAIDQTGRARWKNISWCFEFQLCENVDRSQQRSKWVSVHYWKIIDFLKIFKSGICFCFCCRRQGHHENDERIWEYALIRGLLGWIHVISLSHCFHCSLGFMFCCWHFNIGRIFRINESLIQYRAATSSGKFRMNESNGKHTMNLNLENFSLIPSLKHSYIHRNGGRAMTTQTRACWEWVPFESGRDRHSPKSARVRGIL